MQSAVSPAPPLSVSGVLGALRRPTAADLLVAVKTTIAVVLTLLIGFSQNLDNPYWGALTVYVLVSPPQSGAFRSKAVFRLAGTVLGGAVALLLAALFARDIGILLAAAIVAIVLAIYAKVLDRTPASYTWFVAALTVAVVDIVQVQAPETIFSLTTTRMVEVGLAVLAMALVDSLLLPRAATPDFLRSMADWRDRAAQWAAVALAPDASHAPDVRQKRWHGLLRLASLLGPLDALGVQLPYDIVPTPPRGRDLRFLRLTAEHLIADLAAADLWIGSARRSGAGDEPSAGDVGAWLLERPGLGAPAILDHVARGDDLRARLETSASSAAASDDPVRVASQLRLSELLSHWTQLERILHAIATGEPIPPSLRAAANRARPARSTDYWLGLLDAVPMALALGCIAALWFATNWTSSITAMLFAFISLGFVSGTPGAARAARGIVVWISITCAVALVYQFVVLPRVTAFPLLIAALVLFLAPLSLLMTMSPAGLLIIANGLALIALQETYAADLGASLETVFGAFAGCVIAAAALYLCQFDRNRFSARRLAQALRRDLLDVARSRRLPSLDRLVSLGVDRIVLQAGSSATLPDDAPERRADLVRVLCIAVDVLRLRREGRALSPAARTSINALRGAVALDTGQARSDRLLARIDAAEGAVLREGVGRARTEVLAALTGLRVALSIDPELSRSAA